MVMAMAHCSEQHRFAVLAGLLLILAGMATACAQAVSGPDEIASTAPSASATPSHAPTASATPSPLPTASATISPTPFVYATPIDFDTQRLVVEVPYGPAPAIDGALSAGEWSAALQIVIDEARNLFLLHNDDYLYLGIDSGGRGYGSVCVLWDDDVHILHASAALGSAIFARQAQDWLLTQEFSWCCRERYPGPRQVQHLEQEGWLASITYMGLPREMEYQIDWPEDGLAMAIVYQSGREVQEALRWPESLDDDCLNIVGWSGDLPDVFHFSPEAWPLFVPAPE
jgi:hypothetical protein